MPKYRVLAKSFINNSIVEEGEIVEYAGRAGSNLELIKEDKPRKPAKGAVPAEESQEQAGE